MEVVISKSEKKDKQYKANINGSKNIHFGSVGYSDYTKHHDDKRKENYIKRHQKNEDWNNPYTAGYYSKHILWNQKTLKGSINEINKRFKNTNVKLK